MRIRIVKTASGAFAVQVVRYEGKRTIMLKHIGSAKGKEEILLLKEIASEWIIQSSGQESLFLPEKENGDLLLGKYRYVGFRYNFVYEIITQIFKILGFDSFKTEAEKMLLNFALIRAVEPASKRQSQKLLLSFFGINYSLTDIYRSLKNFYQFKDEVEKKLIFFAKKQLDFDFSFVLYDITTLYFETFKEDNFRKCGFSKDNKVGQPQILIGLIVNEDGFPLSFAVFEGNKFEGHTLIPVILEFKSKHQISSLTVVADAAMISQKNINALKQAGLNYIVGARLGNMSLKTILQINQKLNNTDGACLRLKTDSGFLICSFSAKRHNKDKHEMEKQLEKARAILQGKKENKRNKFLTKNTHVKYSLNVPLVEKTKLLLGVKGYHTNLSLQEKIVIEKYRDLWNIEKTFRISKNDLLIRPIYHFKKQAIIAHILICMISLAVLKFMEIKTGKSAKYIIEELKAVTDGRILNLITGRETFLRSEVNKETKQILQKMGLPH